MIEKIQLSSGEHIIVRTIEKSDAAALINYFSRFSDLTRKRFGPHPFDENTINTICQNLASDTCIRLGAFTGERCVAYCLLQPGILEHDAIRLQNYGLEISKFDYMTYAPSVDESYHGTGLAPAMFLQLEKKAISFNATHIILWGGVQQGNPRAVKFYEKMGFIKVGSFDANGGDDDMVKELRK